MSIVTKVLLPRQLKELHPSSAGGHLDGLPRRPLSWLSGTENRQSLDTVLTHYCHSAKNFDFNLRRDHQKKFL